MLSIKEIYIHVCISNPHPLEFIGDLCFTTHYVRLICYVVNIKTRNFIEQLPTVSVCYMQITSSSIFAVYSGGVGA